MHRKTIIFTTLTLFVLGQHLWPVHAQESVSPPTPSAKGVVAEIAKLPRLAVTTAGIANSIIRTRDPQDRESRVNRTHVQNYASSLAVSADGFLRTDTTWEEEHRPAGTYHEGDALNKESRFLPLRLDDAPIKGSLAQFRSLNFPVRRVSIRP